MFDIESKHTPSFQFTNVRELMHCFQSWSVDNILIIIIIIIIIITVIIITVQEENTFQYYIGIAGSVAGAGPILKVSNYSLQVLGTHNTHFCFYLSSLKFLYFPLSHAYSDIHIGCKTLHLVTLCKTSNLLNGFSSFRVKRGGRGRFIRRDSNQMVTEAYLPLGNM